jgi:hypothetical protein
MPNHLERCLSLSSDNAARRIRCAIATYVLIAIIKKGLRLDAPLHLSTDSLRLHIRKNTDFMHLAANYLKPNPHCHANQMILLDIEPDSCEAVSVLAGDVRRKRYD